MVSWRWTSEKCRASYKQAWTDSSSPDRPLFLLAIEVLLSYVIFPWPWASFQMKNWTLKQEIQQCIILICFHSHCEIYIGCWHPALDLQTYFSRRSHPSKAPSSTQFGQPQAWRVLSINGNIVCLLHSPCPHDGLRGQVWGSEINNSCFTDACIQSFTERWGGQRGFSIWTHWYIPLALIFVTALYQNNKIPDLRKSGTLDSIMQLLSY